MDADSFKTWLDAYRTAWETRDPQAVLALFSEQAVYVERPYQEPMRGREAIAEYWSHIPVTQDDVHVRLEPLAFSGDLGIAHWWASFLKIPSGKRVHLDGVLAATFDADGRCRLFREWWHKREV
jgi:uncharacterized protein (TIGR02246 family)